MKESSGKSQSGDRFSPAFRAPPLAHMGLYLAKDGPTQPGFLKLLETAPDRIIWGSDYPHLSYADKVGSIELYKLLGQWAPDEATRRRILADNPAKLFGF